MSLDDRMSPEEIKSMIARHQAALEAVGGPAYPVSGPLGMPGYAGMSLRDYFAAAALGGFLADPDVNCTPRDAAAAAYRYADALLAARKTPPEGGAVPS